MIKIENKTVYDLLKEACNTYKAEIAIEINDIEITYNLLLRNINKCADAFMEIGVLDDKRVNILSGNNIEVIYALFALNKIGKTVNHINPELSDENIINSLDSSITVIDKENYYKFHNELREMNIKKIIVIEDDMYDNDDIISFKYFMTLSKYYNKTIKRNYSPTFEYLINYHNTYNNKLSINIIDENTINKSIKDIIDIKLIKPNNILLNVNNLYNYIGFNLNLIIPLITGNKVVFSKEENIEKTILNSNITYIIGERKKIKSITKIDSKKLQNIKMCLMISDIENKFEDEMIENYFKKLKICNFYKSLGSYELYNIVTLSSDYRTLGMPISSNIKVIDCITQEKMYSGIGNIIIENKVHARTFNESCEITSDDINTNFVGTLENENLIIIDYLDKEIIRKKLYKTGKPSIDRPWLKYFPEESNYEHVAEKTLYQQLLDSNKERMNNYALIYMGNKIKFSKMIENIDKCAAALIGLGVKKGDYVTFSVPNLPEFVYLFYAVNKIGAISCLIEPRTPALRIKSYIEESKSKYLIMVDLCKKNIDKIIDMDQIKKVVSISPMQSVTDKKIKTVYNLSHKKVKTEEKYIDYNDFIKLGKNINDVKINPYKKNDVATIVYTSGTTGKPKGAMLPNETYNGQNMQLKYSGMLPKPGEVFLGNIPFFSAYGVSSGMHNALSSGVTITLIPSYKYKEFPKLVKKYKPTHVMGVPLFFFFFSRSKSLKKEVLSYVKNCISGGDKMTPSREYLVNEKLNEMNTGNIKKGMGMSEFGGGFLTTVNDEVNKIGSVGIPHVGNNVMIVDTDTNEEITYGRDHKVGELYVTSPTMMVGYLNRDDENKKFFYTDKNGVK